MSRRLILITYNGGPSNYLPGVEKDRIAFLKYFKSRAGGSYSFSEIKEFHNDSELTTTLLDTTIQLLITKEKVNFLTIVFCGHGYGISNGNTILCLGPQISCSVMKLSQICQNVPTLLITDCCRKIYKRDFRSFVVSNFFNVAYATGLGGFALEDRNGGVYSQKLIKASLAKTRFGTNPYYSVSEVHSLASSFVYSETDGEQHPEVKGLQINNILFSFK